MEEQKLREDQIAFENEDIKLNVLKIETIAPTIIGHKSDTLGGYKDVFPC